MSVPNNSSLASLTATYTDSEGEEEHEHEPGVIAGTVILTEESSLSKPPSPVPQIKKKKRDFKRLVSYHDDTYISSEDDDAEASETEDVLEIDHQTSDDGTAHPEDAQNTEESRILAELEAKATAAAVDGVKLPDEPKGKCSAEFQDKINRMYERMMATGFDMNINIQQRKDFRNPSIYEKLIQYCKINELGTNYPTEQYDPLRWGKESFYEELAKVQKTDMDRREKERKEKAKVEIVTGTAKRNLPAPQVLAAPKVPPTAASIAAAATAAFVAEEKRKSKWDQVGGSQQAKPTNPQPTALTANITGTKSTVISAFGSLPKRPRI